MSHTKGKVVLDHSIRTAINMAAPPYQHIAMVNITQNKNYTITKEEHDDNARRIAALWNMAEELGLATEEIENGVIEDMLKMLLELQECAAYWSEYDVPLGIKDRLNETIKKARGEV